MKKTLLIAVVVILTITACEKTKTDIFFKTGSGLEYKYSDLQLYDSSTHVLYFRKVHDEFKNIETGSFTLLAGGEPVYSGTFWPGYSSSGPTGPFIMSPPSIFGNYALRIDNWHADNPDVRSDPRIIEVLKENNLLHSGLAISSSTIEITATQLTFRFTVTNQDQSDLLIIDIDKTGPGLFHYFTNGLYIFDLSHNEVFSSTIQHQTPDPWNTWKSDWLSELKSGASKEFTITYALNNPLNPGEYYATFQFPGLEYQVTIDQLFQGNSRIWLGGIQVNKRITIP